MESFAGRLCHASYAIPLTRHFLDRIEGTITSTTTRKSAPPPLVDGNKRPPSMASVPGQGTPGYLTEPSSYPATLPTVLVRRVPLRNGRVQPQDGEGVADPNPDRQHHLRSPRDQQPARISRDDSERLARMPKLPRNTLRGARLHLGPGRQYVRDWVATQDGSLGPKPTCPRSPPVRRASPRDGSPPSGLLPGFPAH
jgi:hypothetical protein